MGIDVLDHLIIGGANYFSSKERGLIQTTIIVSARQKAILKKKAVAGPLGPFTWMHKR